MLRTEYRNYNILCYWTQLQQIFWLKVAEPFQQSSLHSETNAEAHNLGVTLLSP
jgi:hypothetical protein